MADGLTLLETIITAVLGFLGVVTAALIGAYFTHRYAQRSNPDVEQLPQGTATANIQEGNRTTTNNQLSHQDIHNRVALCCSNCHWIWGRERASQSPSAEETTPHAPPMDRVGTASQSPSAEETTPHAPPVEKTVPQFPPVETLQLMSVVPLITMGTWGYPKYGKNFNFNDLDDIKIIRIFSDSVINSIEVQYRKNQQELYSWTSRVGGDEGSSQEVVLEDGEYITEVTGYYGPFDEIGRLNSLTFCTNKNKTLGPYGSEEESKSTKFNVRGGKIVGFYGTADKKYIHAIGFYVLPVVDPLAMSRDVPPIEVGCWGNPKRGDSFSHSGYNDIKTIKISADGVIDCIQVEYIKFGRYIQTPKVGGHGGTAKPEVTLEDGEYINEVNGSYGIFRGRRAINSLTFHTSRNNKVGPFGKRYHDEGAIEPTDFKVKGGRIVGFYGTSEKYLYSIGFYVSPLI